MASPYLCPVCKANRSEFQLVYKLLQEISKDEETGETLYQGDELTTLVRADGRPHVDVRCRRCGYIGPEPNFAGAALRDGRRAR